MNNILHIVDSQCLLCGVGTMQEWALEVSEFRGRRTSYIGMDIMAYTGGKGTSQRVLENSYCGMVENK